MGTVQEQDVFSEYISAPCIVMGNCFEATVEISRHTCYQMETSHLELYRGSWVQYKKRKAHLPTQLSVAPAFFHTKTQKTGEFPR